MTCYYWAKQPTANMVELNKKKNLLVFLFCNSLHRGCNCDDFIWKTEIIFWDPPTHLYLSLWVLQVEDSVSDTECVWATEWAESAIWSHMWESVTRLHREVKWAV